ncbi:MULTISPECIES: monovalent cation/H+ antiporter complex subunit F [unclassified Carboxylicivirga]|uniref:monovalent cation/H+ antiporter complex subunit F n=1 Tax=Carboxylicivirga TaxID=1628153 RepID=UPI003D344207
MNDNLLEIAFIAAAILLLLSFVMALIRIVKGPTIQDRIVAMDLISSISMGFILVYSMLMQQAMYFDIVIIISLISFIGTVAISTYLKRNK